MYSPDAAVAGRLVRCIIPDLVRGGVSGLDATLVCKAINIYAHHAQSLFVIANAAQPLPMEQLMSPSHEPPMPGCSHSADIALRSDISGAQDL